MQVGKKREAKEGLAPSEEVRDGDAGTGRIASEKGKCGYMCVCCRVYVQKGEKGRCK